MLQMLLIPIWARGIYLRTASTASERILSSRGRLASLKVSTRRMPSRYSAAKFRVFRLNALSRLMLSGLGDAILVKGSFSIQNRATAFFWKLGFKSSMSSCFSSGEVLLLTMALSLSSMVFFRSAASRYSMMLEMIKE